MSAESVAVKPGDTLEGRYRIIKTIGEGGMGTVFLAEHMLINRKVAIKILRQELATDSAVVERFMNEARAAGSIGHPHIVESTDMGFTRNEVPFIVFEYLEGTLLTDEVYRVKGFPIRRALRIATEIASALHAAHNAGIVHRDLKSDNVFLTDKEGASDHVKVLDFGISRFLESDNSNQVSATRHNVMGTPQFMAPEQILAPDTVDARADVYALGVVLYEMLAARRPFEFDSAAQAENPTFEDTDKLLHKIISDAPPALGKPDLPPGLEALIVDKLLAKNPADRFQSMKDVQAALEAFTSVSPTASASLPVAKKPSRIGWLLAALVVGGAGAALFTLDKGTPKSAPVGDHSKDIQAIADKLGGVLDAQAQAAHDRAEGIAGVPMLRAAIETDAATLQDMVKDRDVLFKARPGEVLEIFQDRDGKTTSMLRMPSSAPPIAQLAAGDTRITGEHLIAAADVPNQRGAHEGVVALATPLDLSAFKQDLAPLTHDAAIVGLDHPIVLVGTGAAANSQQFPIKMSAQSHLPGLTLAATVTSVAAQAGPTSAAPSSMLAYARIACFALAGLLLLLFVVLRLRR